MVIMMMMVAKVQRVDSKLSAKEEALLVTLQTNRHKHSIA